CLAGGGRRGIPPPRSTGLTATSTVSTSPAPRRLASDAAWTGALARLTIAGRRRRQPKIAHGASFSAPRPPRESTRRGQEVMAEPDALPVRAVRGPGRHPRCHPSRFAASIATALAWTQARRYAFSSVAAHASSRFSPFVTSTCHAL